MPVPGSEVILLSLRLRGSVLEVERRSATSRLYYGVLIQTVQYLQYHRQFLPPKKGDQMSTFAAVRIALTRWGGQWQTLITLLEDLKASRERADYEFWHLDWPLWEVEDAEMAAKNAAVELERQPTPPGLVTISSILP